MTKQNSPSQLYELLGNAGYPRNYVRSLLPEWWEDEAADTDAGLAEFRLLLSRNLGIEIAGLSSDAPEVIFTLPHERKLKRSTRYTDNQLTPAVSVAMAAARIAAATCTVEYQPLPSPIGLRDVIINSLGGRYVSLRGLIRASWAHGVPIIHLPTFPDGMPKMDGMVASISGRPVVVLSKRISFSAWMSFILAHELGHVWSGHLADGVLIIDEALDERSYERNQHDPEEDEADHFALQALCGDLDADELFTNLDEPRTLAQAALEFQREHQVDAGHLLLRFAYDTDSWQLAIAALGVLDTERRAISDLRMAMTHELALDRVSESSRGFFLRVTGATDALQ